ncbi:MAG TPA: cytochrome c [Pyrinomonadaceae bacterium]|nr:cytochrome c [Pyrinomonadaceae bacterium]
MKLWIFVFAVSALLVAGGCQSGNSNVNTASSASASPAATATPDEFAFARANYARDCAACHGDEGKGGVVKTTEGTKLKVPSLIAGHALKHLDEDYVDQIENGGDGMPKFKDKLTADEINALVRFIRHEFQGRQ